MVAMTTVHKRIFTAIAAVFLASSASAATVFTIGDGSAVTTVDAFAGFESALAVSNSSYTEGGMEFLNTGNYCGYAGCHSHSGFYSGATPFTGNYIYSTGDYTISATDGNVFNGLELTLGSGYAAGNHTYTWSTYLGGNLVTAGNTGAINAPSIYGWSDIEGFDRVVFGRVGNYAAFDNVKASFLAPVPLPATGLMLIFALGGFGLARRKSTAERCCASQA
ncbi:VPLPA-CTERM sorting domain-containing protein [Puniceibacterium sp. IMCC21224]|uniref:VPLPA-CTERM sorting domain-containing protein n=1 Tax=Puniceibacterium sp. IMCC21224 TaxID=1618204 RepID=UPI00064DAD67|nr:VPLPA-CTERM sorting domain-containing protein [Puniceibacterium sp. IMCC21224]KMK67732.1 hypothetical protein IMCC21224_112605 [Puniceibacterium sp. IMCC21224]